jgi:hypothetical protein
MSWVKVKAGVIYTGAHVVENERVWDYAGPSEEKHLQERRCMVLSETRPLIMAYRSIGKRYHAVAARVGE